MSQNEPKMPIPSDDSMQFKKKIPELGLFLMAITVFPDR
jgi:hypothetical protein